MERFVEGQGWLEPLGEFIQKVVGGFYGVLGAPGRALKDVAHGTRFLGHPLHPALTDVPLGAWLVAVVCDLAHYWIPSVPTAAGDLALLVGTLAALGAAATGYTDHHETYGTERRIATFHGLLMTIVVVLMVVSLLLRWRAGMGSHGLAVGLAAVGLVVSLVAAFFGGHLSFGLGTMVNHTAFIHGPEEFIDVAASADVQDGAMHRAQAGEAAVLLVRLGGKLHAIAATCTHAGGPLDEGSLEGDQVTCPWHGSVICVRDGSIRHGPATFPQPRYEAREKGGRIEVRQAAGA